MRIILRVIGVIVLAILGCNVEETGYLRESRQIDSSGGTISVGRGKLTIPPGALSQRTWITVTQTTEKIPDGYVGYSPLYRLSPPGLHFDVPAQLEIATEGAPPDSGIFLSNEGRNPRLSPSGVP